MYETCIPPLQENVVFLTQKDVAHDKKPHSLVGLLPLPKHQKPTVVATDLHSSTLITEEQRKVHLMDILNFNTTQSNLSTKLLGTASITKLQNQHITIPYTILKDQDSGVTTALIH
jgi:hypothetical protein